MERAGAVGLPAALSSARDDGERQPCRPELVERTVGRDDRRGDAAIAVDTVGNSAQTAAVSVIVQALPLPGGWQHADIGNVGYPGDVIYTPGVFSISASGNDIWDNVDAFHFVYQTLTGDGEIIARVASLENTDGWAKAGVMVKKGAEPGSTYAAMLLTGAHGARMQHDFTGDIAGPGTKTVGTAQMGDAIIAEIEKIQA